MKWVKAPEHLKKLLEDVMKNVDCVSRPMFGYPSYFINGNMFVGLFQDKVYARLAEGQLASLRAKYPSIRNLEPMPGKPMKAYYELPSELYSDKTALKKVIEASATHTRSLPEKTKKSKKT